MSFPAPVSSLVLFVAVLAASWAGTGVMLGYLRRRAILDQPNARSSHAVPTPRGGGVAVIAAAGAGWAIAVPTVETMTIVGLALGLAGLSWLDDTRPGGLSAGGRLAAQVMAVAAALWAFGDRGPFLGFGTDPGLRGVDRVVVGLAWIWFVNLYNFMDGIDGMAGVETACLGGGVALCGGLVGDGGGTMAAGVALAGAALGFLWWNWQPARVFLGDVGSVPLGFVLGWLLLNLAASTGAEPPNGIAAALILPLYYLADATVTLCRRLARGERVWQAHRSHFYQHAVRAGLSHAAVVRRVLLVNLVLVALAAAAVSGHPLAAFGGACAGVAGLLFYFATRVPPRSERPARR